MKRTTISPPTLGKKLLQWFTSYGEEFNAGNVLNDLYDHKHRIKGKHKADFWYWKQVLFSIPKSQWANFKWSLIMLKNYLKTTFRNLIRKKGLSFINIAGLSVGMACCVLILLFVHYEFSFDKGHENAENLYRVLYRISGTFRGKSYFNTTTGALALAMKENFPEVIGAARVWQKGEGIVHYQNRFFKETQIYYADPDFLGMFSIPLIHGDSKTALANPQAILLSQETSRKYFGDEDPMGKTLLMDNNQEYQVTGVFRNASENSHIKYDLLISFLSFVQMQGQKRAKEWARFFSPTYFQLREDTEIKAFEKKLQELYISNLPEPPQDSKSNIVVQPITKIHFFTEALNEFEPGGDIRTVHLFMAIAIFIMLIACFNYMNLSTARFSQRAKEVGMRKVIGASRVNLIRQFFSESIVMSILSFAIAILITVIFLPTFSIYVGRDLSLHLFKDTRIVLSLVCLAIFIALVSGSYPAFYLSSFRPIRILKGQLKINSKGPSLFRNSLVTIQFSITIALIICTIITLQQLHYIKDRDLGYNKDHIITMRGSRLFGDRNYETIRNELLQYPQILDMTWSSALTSGIRSGGPVGWAGRLEDDHVVAHILTVDYNYFDFYEMEIIKGRSFSKEFTTDKNNAYILNEKAVKEIGWHDPIGKMFSEDPDMSLEGPVIGVVKDFHYAPLHLEIQPLHIRLMEKPYGWLSLRISSQRIPETLNFLKQKWEIYAPEYPFEYSFLDDRLNRIYQSEQKLGQSFNGFSILAVLIACLGLFGLASFLSEQRTKEIGIRKVLGASTRSVVTLFSKEFVKWIIISNIIAWPIAYFAMNKWLQNFAYRININIWFFIASGFVALVISILTVSYHATKAALTNPVDSLRYE